MSQLGLYQLANWISQLLDMSFNTTMCQTHGMQIWRGYESVLTGFQVALIVIQCLNEFICYFCHLLYICVCLQICVCVSEIRQTDQCGIFIAHHCATILLPWLQPFRLSLVNNTTGNLMACGCNNDIIIQAYMFDLQSNSSVFKPHVEDKDNTRNCLSLGY